MNRRAMEISLGALVIFSLAILAYVALKMGHLKGIGSYVEAEVVFANAAGLVEGASVRIAGVQVGRVKSLAVDFDKARAILLLEKSAKIRSDATVSVRARSLLGEKYVEIIPASREAPLAMHGTQLTARPAMLEIDQLLGELGGPIQELDVAAASALVGDLQLMVEENRSRVGSVLIRVDNILNKIEQLPLDDPNLHQDIRAIVRNVRSASDELPGLLLEGQKTMLLVNGQLTVTMDRANQLMTEVEPAVQKLPHTVDQLDSVLSALNIMLVKIDPLLDGALRIDYSLVQKLLREEGLLVRVRSQDVDWTGATTATPADTAPGNDTPDRTMSGGNSQTDNRVEGSVPRAATRQTTR